MTHPPLAQADGSPRRCYATMVFSDLCGSTRIARALEEEDYHALLGHIRRIQEEAIVRRGGAVAQVSGDGMLALFGCDGPSERDAASAVDAVLEVHAAVRRLAVPSAPGLKLAMHSGVHAGLVLLRSGDAVHGRFEALGSATNIVSRLAAVAGADELLVSAATLGPGRDAYLATALSVTVRDWPDPLAVLRVTARAPATAPRRPALVGREQPLAAVAALVDRVAAGGGGCATIVGGLGVGKSRVGAEALSRAADRGCRTFRVECRTIGGAPLEPLVDWARDLAGDAPPGEAVRRLLSGGADAAAATGALRGLVRAAVAEAPLVVLIDDWHAADDATHRVIGALAGDPEPRLLVLLAARTAPGTLGTLGEIVALPPLTRQDAIALVALLLPAADPFTAGEIALYSGGNPLFVEELCHAARAAEGAEWSRRPRDGRGWLDLLIAARFADLPPRHAALLRAAAVAGAATPAWLFEQLTGCAASDPDVAELAARDFLFADPDGATLRFKHGVARDAIYDVIALDERRARHAEIAAALEARAALDPRDVSAELAYHHERAGNPRAAADHAERAGDRALAVSALDRAQQQYRAALASLARLEDDTETARRGCTIGQRLGMAAVFDPSHAQLAALGAIRDRAAAHGDAAGAAGIGYWLGYLTYALGDGAAAAAQAEAVRASAAALGREQLARAAETLLGQARASACDYRAALPLLDRAVAGDPPDDPRERVERAYAAACRAAVLADLGRFDEAEASLAWAEAAVAGLRHEVEGSVLCWRSAVALWRGRPGAALAHARAAQAVAERVHSIYVYAMARSLAAYAAWTETRAPEALRALAEATQWLTASGRNLFVSLNHGWLAEALAGAGRFAEARAAAAAALRRARCGDRLGEAMACRAMARAAASGHGRRSPDHYLRLAARSADARDAPHERARNLACAAAMTRGDEAAALHARAGEAAAALGLDLPSALTPERPSP